MWRSSRRRGKRPYAAGNYAWNAMAQRQLRTGGGYGGGEQPDEGWSEDGRKAAEHTYHGQQDGWQREEAYGEEGEEEWYEEEEWGEEEEEWGDGEDAQPEDSQESDSSSSGEEEPPSTV